MMTCEHVIKREMIQQRKKISFYYDSIKIKTQEIELDPEKRCIQDFVRLNEIDNNIDINIDATVIEILPEDNISQDNFLSPNENYLNNYDNLTNQDIAIMQYPERDLEYYYGKIKQIDKYQITHTANTKPGSSGSPIFLVNTFKVVGIHQGGNTIKSENYGYCIGPIFNFFRYYSDIKKIMNKNMYNQIDNQLNKMTLIYEIKEDPVRIFGEKFVERNKNNCYLLINGKERKLCKELYKNEINPTNGIFKIILIEKKNQLLI